MRKFRALLDVFATTAWADRPSLLLYIAEIAIFRVSGLKLRRKFSLRIAGFKFQIRANSGDLGCIHEILVRNIYGKDSGFLPRAGDTCIDVGANIGCVSLQWSRVNLSGRILAVEPHPVSFARLGENVRLNGISNVKPINAAAGASNGYATMQIPAGSNMARVAGSKMGNLTNAEERIIACLTIDELIARENIERVHLLKIDVEGYEVECLRGATQTLRVTDRIILEHHNESLRQECRAILTGSGFRLQEEGDLFFARRC